MKILEAAQIRALDAYTIQNEPIASIDLMERAATAFVEALLPAPANTSFHIFCGLGNNGGDGLAIARLLLNKNRNIKVSVVVYQDQTSPDFAINLKRLEKSMPIHYIRQANDLPDLLPHDWVIDALLGSGLSRPVEGLLAGVIGHINASGLPVYAVDIASGLYADKPTPATAAVLRPQHTFSFELPKLAFFMPDNAAFVGQWRQLPIGLSAEGLGQQPSPYFFTLPQEAESYYKPRSLFAHKGTFGHALLVAGSFGKMGAAVLSAKACLRSGVGLLSVQIPLGLEPVIQISVPEAMLAESDALDAYQAIGIGPGLGKLLPTLVWLEKTLHKFQEQPKPLVLDADALNLIAENPDLKRLVPKNTILTPHPKEFERWVGPCGDAFERLQKARDLAQAQQWVIVLKGAYTAVVLPDGSVHFNSTGNPGMATGGSGDVLTGILTALLAQGYQPSQAAILGVYQHGLAGDKAAQARSQTALIASDIIDHLWL